MLACLGGCAPGPAVIAELERPATDADRLPAGWDLTGLVFPSTIRYAGTVDEVRVYVALAPVGKHAWRPDPDSRGLEFCLMAVDDDGMGSSCGRLPLDLQTSGVELRLVGTGAEVPDGYERLSDSVVVLDRAGLSRLVG